MFQLTLSSIINTNTDIAWPQRCACRTNVKYDNVRTRRGRAPAEPTPAYYFRVERS